MQWSWPNPDWLLIGFERWDYFKKFPHSRLMEAMYQHPSPSTLAEWRAGDLIPVGHWHVIYDRSGLQQSSTWVPNALEEPRNLYLKGQDNGKGKGKGPGGEGKGKGPADKVKGKGPVDKGKGKGKGTDKGKGRGKGRGKGGAKSKGPKRKISFRQKTNNF